LALILDLMELEAYADAKRQIAEAEKEEDVKSTPMVDLVFENEAEIHRQAIRRMYEE
jgi:hypothetical protein